MDEILKSIQRIIAEDERTSTPPVLTQPVPPRPATAPAADDVLELTEALNEDGTTRRLTPSGGITRPIEPASPSVIAAERISAPSPREDAPPLREDRIEPVVSADIAVVAGGALSAGTPVSTVEPEAHREPEVERTSAAPAAGRTLEDLISELLRPMLKTWLDENLPPLVERLARVEIARVAEKSGSGGV